MIISNIVSKNKVREVQSETLEVIKSSLLNSFGPMGSNSILSAMEKSGDVITKYTKDGHTILKSIVFQNVIEQGIKTDLEDCTSNVVQEVGDGTTSAIILSQIIFEKLKELEANKAPYEIIREFKICVEAIKTEIVNNTQEFTAEKAYNIALISTNGNTDVATNIANIYKEFGNDVYVDVSTSTTGEDILKTYDGMTLETGYADTAYINDVNKGVSTLRNPRVYAFEDPIDTPEMMALFNAILEKNIMNHYAPGATEPNPVPTIILAPTVSRDMSAYMEKLVTFMYGFAEENMEYKPPFLLISNIYQRDQFVDIARMCGCPMIKKYINPDQQSADIENGLAPNMESVVDFYGSADLVESNVVKTKFVNPRLMHNEDGSVSEQFTVLVTFLESELAKAKEEGEDNGVTGTLKRRINSLKANMVEYLVGGISVNDRDSVKDLVEDSVLNCRSAAKSGVGFGANFEGLLASSKLKDNSEMYTMIYNAYYELSKLLYGTAISCDIEVCDIINHCIAKQVPFNIMSKGYDRNVLCSIDTDITVLDTISRIVTLIFTANQFICPSPIYNKYLM